MSLSNFFCLLFGNEIEMQPNAYYVFNKNINNVRQQVTEYFSKIFHLRIQQPVIELMFHKAY